MKLGSLPSTIAHTRFVYLDQADKLILRRMPGRLLGLRGFVFLRLTLARASLVGAEAVERAAWIKSTFIDIYTILDVSCQCFRNAEAVYIRSRRKLSSLCSSLSSSSPSITNHLRLQRRLSIPFLLPTLI